MSNAYLISVPNAPLDHADEKEHRRLIARRANSIHFEHTLFTPTLTFATAGDLSMAYTQQTGGYWWLGELLYFHLELNCTPTHTTASGEMRIDGLPYAQTTQHDSESGLSVGELSGTGITWPGSRTMISGVIRPGEDFVVLKASGSALATTAIQASDHTSATAFKVTVAGFYPATYEDN